jgi:hypothetical protein
MAFYEFKKDLKIGHRGESIAKGFLETNGMIFLNNNDDFRYDLKMFYPPLKKTYTYEVKFDVHRPTGNIAIEYECRGKPSGISTTEADYFLTYFKNGNEIWNIPTERLKKLIKYSHPKKTTNSGDTGSFTKLYLIDKKKYGWFFKIHKL